MTQELNINILRPPASSLVKKVLGTIYILLALAWIVIRLIFNEPEPARFPLPFLDIIYCIVFGLTGIIFLIEGSGKSIGSLFGEAYIKIDRERLRIKKGIFEKEWILTWAEIAGVEFRLLEIEFKLADGRIIVMDFDRLDYEDIQEIKKLTRAIAVENKQLVEG